MTAPTDAPSPVPALIERTRRVPRLDGTASSDRGGAAVARQLDAVLATVGFACSTDLLAHLRDRDSGEAMDRALEVIAAARRLVGDHVRHNAYFLRFPDGVPDTMTFWVECLRDAILVGARGRGTLAPELVSLLELPRYGTYQHSYDDLVAAHDALVASVGDRLTVLHLGGTVDDEAAGLLAELAGSTTPLSAGDVELLGGLLDVVGLELDVYPRVAVAENRALIDAARVRAGGTPLLATSPTDVLRVAAALSGGDVTLVERVRFASLPRRSRRALLAGLDRVLSAHPTALPDVAARAETWKRLGERLHPHEHPAYPRAAEAFAVARGDRRVRSAVSAAELFAADAPADAARVLATAPGVLVRWADRLLRHPDADTAAILDVLEKSIPSVAGRVLLSLREHLDNRDGPARRLFVNRRGRAHVEPDARLPLDPTVRDALALLVDAELGRRVPAYEHLVVDPAILDVALPLSGKATADGLAMMPRGTTLPLPPGDRLRFFSYWRETERRTDYDLSALMLDDELRPSAQVSWTQLRGQAVTHSGDVVSAPDGASEFIDVDLPAIKAAYVVPQVLVYAGEGFDEVAESFVGWMIRDRAQDGMPFEPRTVRARSELRGAGRVALPAAFHRDPTGRWHATWLHLSLAGSPRFSGETVEGNRVTTSELVGAILRRRYLTVRHVVALLETRARAVTRVDDSWHAASVDGPVTYLGLTRPDGLPDGSTAITLETLSALIPA